MAKQAKIENNIDDIGTLTQLLDMYGNPVIMLNEAPKLAAEDIPNVYGLANGFPNILCI